MLEYSAYSLKVSLKRFSFLPKNTRMSFILWDAVLGEHSSIFAISLVVMQILNNLFCMVYTLTVSDV
jgi:hypothetical protein